MLEIVKSIAGGAAACSELIAVVAIVMADKSPHPRAECSRTSTATSPFQAVPSQPAP